MSRAAFPALILLSVVGSPQIVPDYKVEKVAANLAFAEGPAWSRDGYMVFSDIPNNKIMKWVPGEGVSTYRENSGGANGNAFDDKGRLYTCEGNARRVTRTDKSGKVEVLAEQFEGKHFNAPNDIVVSRNGHVYFTDPAFGSSDQKREMQFYGVYHITPKGELNLLAKPQGRPNGIALSPNGKLLYVANSDERNIRAYDIDRDGKATNERVLISNITGVPDGIRTDEKGNIYVAAEKVEIYDASGKSLGSYPMSETPSNIGFGDPDGQTLYITARTSVYRIRLNVKGTLPYQP